MSDASHRSLEDNMLLLAGFALFAQRNFHNPQITASFISARSDICHAVQQAHAAVAQARAERGSAALSPEQLSAAALQSVTRFVSTAQPITWLWNAPIISPAASSSARQPAPPGLDPAVTSTACRPTPAAVPSTLHSTAPCHAQQTRRTGYQPYQAGHVNAPRAT